MTAAPAVKPVPVPQAATQYDQENERRYRRAIGLELDQKHDKRSDLRLSAGKYLVFAASDGTEYGMGLDGDAYLTLTNYATGVAGTFVIDMPRVDGLEQEFIDVRAEFASADSALSSAYAAADAVVAADAASANASLSTTLTAAYQAADATTLGSAQTYADAAVSTEASARASADSAEATLRETLEAAVQAGTYSQGGWNALVDSEMQQEFISWRDMGPGNVGITRVGGFDLYGASQCPYYAVQCTGTPVSGKRIELLATRGVYDGGVADPDNAVLYGVRVVPGERYFIGGIVASSGCTYVECRVQWLNESGASPSDALIDTGTGPTYVGDMSVWEEVGDFVTVPSGKAIGIIYFRGIVDGTADPFAAFAKPLFVRVNADQTARPIYSPSRPEPQTASVNTLKTAFIDTSTGDAYAVFDAEAAAGGFSAMLRMYAGDGSSSIGLYAEQLFLGDNTVFEDTYNTFYTTYSSYRLRNMGPFGASGDLLLWYGPTSVSLNSETKTNGVMALATDGKLYVGSDPANALSGVTLDSYFQLGFTSAGTGYSGTVTATAIGGDGTYTYLWMRTGESGPTRTTCSNTGIQTPTFSVAAGGTSADTWTCTITETSTGRSYQASVRFDVSLI